MKKPLGAKVVGVTTPGGAKPPPSFSGGSGGGEAPPSMSLRTYGDRAGGHIETATIRHIETATIRSSGAPSSILLTCPYAFFLLTHLRASLFEGVRVS